MEVDFMNKNKRSVSARLMNKNKRYISVRQSLLKSCKEVKDMRTGKLAEPSWNDFYEEMQKEIEKEAV